VLLAQAVLGGMPSLLAMKPLPDILLFPIVLIISLIISLILLGIFAAFTSFNTITTTFATFLYNEQSFWSEPILSRHCRFLFDELGDDLICRGGHCGIFVHHELKEDIPLIVPSDSAKEVQDVHLLTHLGDCLCTVRIGISVSGRLLWAEIVILDFPIDS
jgi:hypothetical protein